MKTTKSWAQAFFFTLSIFVWTTNSSFAQEATSVLTEKAFITTRTIQVTSEPNSQSLAILQLKQGDAVEVLEKKDQFLKIRFRIDGDFPVEGWIPQAATSQNISAAAPTAERQPYEAAQKTAPEAELKEFPTQNLPEQIQPQIQPSNLNANSKSLQSPKEIHRRSPGPWLHEGHFILGHNTWKESLKTKREGSQDYGDNPFLSYQMSGIFIGFSGKALRQQGNWEWGGIASYSITFFRGSIPSTSTTYRPGIDQGNVQALMHELIIGPTTRYSFQINPNWAIIPELKLLPIFDLFSTNQLKSTDNVNPGVSGQSVLYSFTGARVDAEFAPEIMMPYHLRLTPMVGMTLYNYFVESPVLESSGGVALSDSEKLRTGVPDGSPFALSYGAKLAWNLKFYGWETMNLTATYKVTDYSKNYKGQGNRAGVKTFDVKTKASAALISLGMDYLF